MAIADFNAEIPALRDRDARHYFTDEPDSRVAIIHPGQNFFNRETQQWDWTENLTAVGDDGIYRTQSSEVYFEIDSVAGSYNVVFNGVTVSFQPNTLSLYDTSTGQVVDIAEKDATPAFTFNNNVATWVDVFPGVDLTIYLSEFEMRKEIILKSRPTTPDLLALGMNPDTTQVVITFIGKSDGPV